ncbi:hypothetical protein INR49_003063 [Caranx melampygus]|nr:hypothetical protein INR49_003063 [Caranx melampygus]
MCLAVDDDGEFWMTVQDFCKFYEDLDICCTTPDFLDQNSAKWNTSTYEGRWVAGTTAGGCMNNRESYWTNPQYRIKIECQHSESNGEKNMLVSLMQKPDKRNRRLVQNLHIGFSVFEVSIVQDTEGEVPSLFLQHPLTSGPNKNLRECP